MGDRPDYERRDEDDEEEELGEIDYKAQKDALIFAIDVSSSMLQAPPHSDNKKADKDSAVLAALKCANQLMQQRIISNPKDMMGILFFGTEKTKFREGDANRSALGYPHCYVYTDLDIPSAEDVKSLKGLLEEGSEEATEILVPAKEQVSMSSVLFCANQIFTTKAPNFGSRRLFIITDNDDPHANDKKSKEAAATRAKDLYDLGVTIDLFAITRGDTKFELTKFYDDIIYRDPTSEETSSYRVSKATSGDGITLMNSLVSNINSKQTPKRAYFSNMPFELGPGLTISVKGYLIMQKQAPARSCYVWLDDEKAQIAVGETARIAEDSARTVETGEVKKAYKFGGEYVYFSEEEQSSIKQFGSAAIRIIGFKDRSLLKFWHAVKKSTFIFPSEEGFVGSTRVFSALWTKLLKSNKIGVAWHIARKNGNPQLVAIVPSRGPSDETSGIEAIPAGLWLVPIPFADDVREPPEGVTGRPTTTPDLATKMHTIIRQLQLPAASYNPAKYPNPALQWHYRILQALALEDEVPEQPDDATVPKYRAIHKRCGAYIQEWSAAADEAMGQIQDRKSVKRDLDDDDDAPPRSKKTKSAAPSASKNGESGASSDAVLKKRYKDGTLSKLTVADLKTVLVERGIEAKGLKKDLVERVEQWAEDNM
ncbi:SPOC like C-terminal domain-containing protein [Microdochium bolleyi]|uniref:ATP-dependent DNA helicase II subunit 1 n=1 Tax=Microdochium bolleyi TaxID=196109 RepID=A0A136JEL6_9PEZI|nr:SPOC like C-terminal domain-containing protein [Microdochium bolleyi]